MRNKGSYLAKQIDRDYVNNAKGKIRSFKKQKCMECKNKHTSLCNIREENEKIMCDNYKEI